MTLWWFPLEPLDERYTANWVRWFPEEFEKHDLEWQEMPGDTLTRNIEEGEFLDIFGRPYFALSQIKNLVVLMKTGNIGNGDSLFFADLWHHGLEVLPYIRDLSGRDIKIYGIFHAGSYDPYDFMKLQGTTPWAKYFEKMVGQFVDKIFVGSQWSKELLVNNRIIDSDKVIVTGLPLKSEEILEIIRGVKRTGDKKYVVFPHRIALEKGIIKMIQIMSRVFEETDDIYLCVTSGRGKLQCRDEYINSKFQKFLKSPKVKTGAFQKIDYYRTLASCHVVLSTALQETFGYGVLEAALCGCTPVVPDRLSYPDILLKDERLFYDSNEEAVEKVIRYCNDPINVSSYAKHYTLNNTIGRMLEEMDLV